MRGAIMGGSMGGIGSICAGILLLGCGKEPGGALLGEDLTALYEDVLGADGVYGEVETPEAGAAGLWSQVMGDAGHAKGHLALEGVGLPEVLWEVRAGEGSRLDRELVVQPVAGGGRVYVMDSLMRVRAYGAEGGEELWEYDARLLGESARAGIGGGLALSEDGEFLYAATGLGTLVMLGGADGEEVWRRDTGAPYISAPALSEGLLVVTARGERVYGVEAESGEELWVYEGLSTGVAEIATSFAPAILGGVVYAPSSEGLKALRAESGRLAWTYKGGEGSVEGDLADGTGSPAGLSDGILTMGWSRGIARLTVRGEGRWEGEGRGMEAPWVAGDVVYYVTRRAQLACQRLSDGKVLWVRRLEAFTYGDQGYERRLLWRGPVLAGDRLFLGGSDGRLRAHDPRTGEVVWEDRLDGGVAVAPLVAEGRLYVLTRGGRLRAYR